MDFMGNMSLHQACWNGQDEAVCVLIEKGMNANDR